MYNGKSSLASQPITWRNSLVTIGIFTKDSWSLFVCSLIFFHRLQIIIYHLIVITLKVNNGFISNYVRAKCVIFLNENNLTLKCATCLLPVCMSTYRS